MSSKFESLPLAINIDSTSKLDYMQQSKNISGRIALLEEALKEHNARLQAVEWGANELRQGLDSMRPEQVRSLLMDLRASAGGGYSSVVEYSTLEKRLSNLEDRMAGGNKSLMEVAEH